MRADSRAQELADPVGLIEVGEHEDWSSAARGADTDHLRPLYRPRTTNGLGFWVGVRRGLWCADGAGSTSVAGKKTMGG